MASFMVKYGLSLSWDVVQRLGSVSIPLLEGDRVDPHPSFSLCLLISYMFPYLHAYIRIYL